MRPPLKDIAQIGDIWTYDYPMRTEPQYRYVYITLVDQFTVSGYHMDNPKILLNLYKSDFYRDYSLHQGAKCVTN